MKLKDLGFSSQIGQYRNEAPYDSFEVARVVAEHRERYILRNEDGELEAELIGNLRYSAASRSELPAVGDWVAISLYEENKALIHAVYPRNTVIERSAVGKSGEIQIIAANIDYAFIVQAVDRDFNLNRLERYLTICYNAGVEPLIILSKTDLLSASEIEDIILSIKKRKEDLHVFPISNTLKTGYNTLQEVIHKGKSYCLMGSSGVGKSSLINNLLSSKQMKTGTISDSTGKGRHVTSHRELFITESGALVIDTPGMRELGITDSSEGLDAVFDTIAELSGKCKYQDCTHTNESGCAVLSAIENGEVDPDQYENYLKMLKEREHFESTQEDKRRKDKDLSKVVKNYYKFRRLND